MTEETTAAAAADGAPARRVRSPLRSDLTWAKLSAIRESELPAPQVMAEHGITAKELKRVRKMTFGMTVEVQVDDRLPEDYHCQCAYCTDYIGELRKADGTYYSRLERNGYYIREEKGKGGHIAKTPLHVARWAIQEYSRPGDWVLDPTIGAGTTAVEAITQGRSVAGMELEYGRHLEANVVQALERAPATVQAEVAAGDARNLAEFLKGVKKRVKAKGPMFSLMVNNPPYFGDISHPSPSSKGRGVEHRHEETRFDYDKTLPNIAFLGKGGGEQEEYWRVMRAIYSAGIAELKVGGHVVIGIKDQMRNWAPDNLHERFCAMLSDGMGLEFVGTALLKHYPTTLFMNTYQNKKAPDGSLANVNHVPPVWYQTINVFRKIT